MASIATRIANFFDPGIRRRGQHYFDEGRVMVRRRGARRIEAYVEGSRNYDVSLEIDGNTLTVECDCPYFTGERDCCKHVWALILEADRSGAARGWLPDYLDLDGDDGGFEPDFDDEDEGWIDPFVSTAAPRAARTAAGLRSSPPAGREKSTAQESPIHS